MALYRVYLNDHRGSWGYGPAGQWTRLWEGEAADGRDAIAKAKAAVLGARAARTHVDSGFWGLSPSTGAPGGKDRLVAMRVTKRRRAA